MSYPFRPATIPERRQFYEKQFSESRLKHFFRGKLPQLCALDAGTDTGIIVDKRTTGFLLYCPFTELPDKIRKYVPEDVYYDRNTYDNPTRVLETLSFDRWKSQELVFDIDADNIDCACRHVCTTCLHRAYTRTRQMATELRRFFRDITIVYSGGGFHIHVFDTRAYTLTIAERDALNRQFRSYPIDPWVSRGHIGLIRVPYSLNGVVSRIVTPVTHRPGRETVPRFLTLSSLS